MNVGTLYNLPPNTHPKNNGRTSNAPRRRSLLGHIGGAIKYGTGAALGGVAYLGRQSAQRGINVQVGGKNKKQPTKPPNANNRRLALLAQNEAIAAQRRNQWNGANESERPVSFAGALPAVLGGAAIQGFSSAQRAHNLSQAARTGFYSAKTLRHAVL